MYVCKKICNDRVQEMLLYLAVTISEILCTVDCGQTLVAIHTCHARKKTTPRIPGGNMRADRPQEPAPSVKLP